mmetsp:Transcript_26121/g.39688  ORF Transcript_26121/g.39688 Transcript_26121/m.39688 type:complete len:212 (-) Transcript_26121:23-658(-)
MGGPGQLRSKQSSPGTARPLPPLSMEAAARHAASRQLSTAQSCASKSAHCSLSHLAGPLVAPALDGELLLVDTSLESGQGSALLVVVHEGSVVRHILEAEVLEVRSDDFHHEELRQQCHVRNSGLLTAEEASRSGLEVLVQLGEGIQQVLLQLLVLRLVSVRRELGDGWHESKARLHFVGGALGRCKGRLCELPFHPLQNVHRLNVGLLVV